MVGFAASRRSRRRRRVVQGPGWAFYGG